MRCRAERDGKLEIGGRETVRVGVDEEAEREREERINKVEILRGFELFMRDKMPYIVF